MDGCKWICTHGYPEIWHEKLIWNASKHRSNYFKAKKFDSKQFKKDARKLYEKHMRITN